MAAKYDAQSFLGAVMDELAARLAGGFQRSAEPAAGLERRRRGALESFSLVPNYRGLPRLLLNPTALIAFDVGDTPLAARPARPGGDPTKLNVLHNWSSIVTRKPPPAFVALRTRLRWKLQAPSVFLEADVFEPPAAAAARLESPIRATLLPFFERFHSLEEVRRSLEADDGATLALNRIEQLVQIDVALGDFDHLASWCRRCADPSQRARVATALAPFLESDSRWRGVLGN